MEMSSVDISSDTQVLYIFRDRHIVDSKGPTSTEVQVLYIIGGRDLASPSGLSVQANLC